VVAQGSNGIEAVELVRVHKPDVVFLDVQMPGLDGFAVLKKLIDKKMGLPQIVFATGVRPVCGARVRGQCGRLSAEAVRFASGC